MSISDFSIQSRLGQGSFSTVYKVLRKSDEKFYALKRVRYNELRPKDQKNALNEIRVLASIDSPHVISYKEAFPDPATHSLCVVMEYAEGGDLAHKIQEHIQNQTHFEEETLWDILRQSLQGLFTLHYLGILHRDIKSANILVGANGAYKLGDLNICKAASLAKSAVGTPYYASPEIWRGKEYNLKSDVWSLGVTMYELACLEVPFQSDSMIGVCKKVLSGKYPPLSKLYSKKLAGVIRQMLMLDPNKRPTPLEVLKICDVDQRLNLRIGSPIDNAKLLETIKENEFSELKDKLPRSKYHRKTNSVHPYSVNKENSEFTPLPCVKDRLRKPRGKSIFNIFARNKEPREMCKKLW